MSQNITDIMTRFEDLKRQVSNNSREKERLEVRLEESHKALTRSIEQLADLGFTPETVESKISENADKISRALSLVEGKLHKGVDPVAVPNQ